MSVSVPRTVAHLVVRFRRENVPLLPGDVDGVQVTRRNVLVCLVLVATKHIDGLTGPVVDSTVAIHPCQHIRTPLRTDAAKSTCSYTVQHAVQCLYTFLN